MDYYFVKDVFTCYVLCVSIPVVSIDSGTSDAVSYLIQNDSQCMHNTREAIILWLFPAHYTHELLGTNRNKHWNECTHLIYLCLVFGEKNNR